MRSGKGNQEYDEYEEEDFNSKKDGPSSNTSNNLAAANTKDKNSEKANAIRSKHSVTEQRRRSKINERFQILRDLIPHSEQKRDTASFLLEVIDYVKYLQEKVQKYEGSYPAWSSEPTKLMPWRNSHWRVPSFVGQPHPAKNGSGAVPTISGKFEENNIGIASSVMVTQQNSLDLESGQDLANKSMDQQAELSKQEVHNPIPAAVRSDGVIADPLQRPGQDSQSAECPITGNILARQEDLAVEGGTISISSVYSQGLLNTLTEALQSAGIDLSQARISVQIDLGKRANRGSTSGTFTDHEGSLPGNSVMAHVHGEDSTDHLQKRQKT